VTASDHHSPTPAGQLAPYLKTLRRHKLLIVLVTIAAAAVALALSLTSTKEYEATAKVFISQTNPVQNIVGQNEQQPQDPERDLNSKVALIKLASVAQAVKSQLHLHSSTQELLDEVSTSIEGTTEIVDIDVTDPHPRRAAEIANAFAKQFAAARQVSARQTIQQAATLAQQQLNGLQPADRAGPQGRELTNQLRQLQIAAALQTGGIEVASPASAPTSPSSPKTKRNTILAGFLGLILAIALALAVEAADRRIKDEEDLDGYEAPVLATVPRPRGRGTDEDFATREAFSTLATNLRFFQLGHEVSAVMITSPAPQEGKTTTTLGLGRALASLGLRVLAIECDLRRPMFGSYTGLTSSGGLSTVLAGVSEFNRELIDLDADTLRPLDAGDDSSRPYLTVMPAGPIPPNPQGLLGSAAMREVMRSARATAEVVLLDTAPVGTVNDVVTLADLVDGVALVVRLQQTRRDRLARAMRTLGNLPAPVLGFVLTDVRRSTDAYYGYDRPTVTPHQPVG